jgi:hypothetical protein
MHLGSRGMQPVRVFKWEAVRASWNGDNKREFYNREFRVTFRNRSWGITRDKEK